MLTRALRQCLFSGRVAASAPAGSASWPFTGNGAEAGWTATGGGLGFGAWGWDAGNIQGGGATDTDIVSLTGSALTTFAAAVTFNTAILVSISVVPDPFQAEDAAVRVHGGSWVPLNITAGGWSTPVAVTTGAVAGFEIRGASAGTDMTFDNIDIDLA